MSHRDRIMIQIRSERQAAGRCRGYKMATYRSSDMVARIKGVFWKVAVDRNSRGIQYTIANFTWPMTKRKSSTEDKSWRVSLISM